MGLFDRLRRKGNDAGELAAELLFEQGKKAFDRGDYRRAADAFASSIRLQSDVPNSHFLLGACLFRLGETAAAVKPLSQCLGLDPDHAEARNALGMTLGRLGRHEEADIHLAKAAYLGHVQAPGTLAKMGVDFCRTCAAPVYSTAESDADVVIVPPEIGWKCAACRTVGCGRCVTGNGTSTVGPRCPHCSGPLVQLTK
ncbi:tetratricopeptide repeat protein [Streptomyces desertarenae]|uniref:Tetratricopeptide repeat protein n=1 Tax=Streptomyces desertarenae TaxID=2666184 RepID=A0ABW4PGL1_9ACTN